MSKRPPKGYVSQARSEIDHLRTQLDEMEADQ